jgi:glutathione synthase/RimK-type ligase-like ATP-grasp enzyme
VIVLVTNRCDYAADRVVVELGRRGRPFVRLNTEDFPTETTGTFRLDAGASAGPTVRPTGHIDLALGRRIVVAEVTAIWYRRPEPSRVDDRIVDAAARRFAQRESAAALHGLLLLAAAARWVNHPEANRSAESKLVQLAAAVDEGLRVPRTLITNDPAEARAFHAALDGRVVVKSVAAPFVAADDRTRVYTNRVRTEHVAFLDDLAHAPVILQERIAKREEARVVVAGERVLGVAIESQAATITRDDWRRDVFQAPHRRTELPDDVAERCVRLTRRLGLAFAVLDLVVTPDGDHVFLELNPNGEWDWLEAITDLPVAAAITDLLVV